ncbi:variant erythrocyte surface antigen-1 family protein [Babesia caballi]|uniref:Variant erythrocyte surface antigen-1 family protein n=1 Tax=Babesia caballi TaxID=5871 RepID=A0AAV4LLC1_BABCB|nr:variant erythrocyte surface antigen-1 family protein [Babesia caballi]
MSKSGAALTECPSNLKEAIDWLLRVTGKDGQNASGGGNTNGTLDLAKQVNELLTSAIGESSDPATDGKDADMFKALREWLNKNQNGDDIKNLMESLSGGIATLIGYHNGTITFGSSGIGLPNDPRERLGDAVLGFLYELLNSLVKTKGESKINLSGVHPDNLLKKFIGTGKSPVDNAIQKVANLTDKSNQIKDVVSALKTVTNLKSQDTISKFAPKVKEYLKKVLEEVAKNGDVKSIGASVKVHEKPMKVTEILQEICSRLTALIQKFEGFNGKPFSLNQNGIPSDIAQVKHYNAHLNPSNFKNITATPKAKALASAVHSATSGFLSQLQKQTYVSSYLPTATWDGCHKVTCAKIFLGCIPLYYYTLTYLYWLCRGNGGEWKELKFNDTTGGRQSLRYFMAATGFNVLQLSGNTGQRVMTAVAGKLPELSSSTGDSFPKFLNKIQTTLNGAQPLPSNFTRHTIAALILTASMYFQRKQRESRLKESQPPSTIRGMLYWMSGLTITPQFADLLSQFGNVVPSNFKVAVSGSSGGQSLQPLTADDLSGHLIPACILSPNILGLIQGGGDSTDSEPWLHALFSNRLGLSYPSGLDLFRVLCDYVYAVQFQLSFLVQMCISNSVNGGWQNCMYGKDVQPDGKGKCVKSWICPIISGCKNERCQHNNPNVNCKHNDGRTGCGRNSNSPLQAFLTDCLEGFRHNTLEPVSSSSPNYPNHYGNHPKGFMCHVPMGFTSGTLRSDVGSGYGIFIVLRIFSATNFNPFRQLCEKLVCLSKRTPKTLGDLFGFLWHFCNQVFNKRNIMDDFAKLRGDLQDIWSPLNVVKKIHEALNSNSNTYKTFETSMSLSNPTTGLSLSFKALQSSEALFFLLFQAGIPNALDSLARHCHKWETDSSRSITLVHKDHIGKSCSNPNDLWSLHQGVSTQPQQPNKDRQADCRKANCGGYVNSLTLASGAVFAPDFAATYLSWLVYLTEEFYEWLSEFLVNFNNISCDNCSSCTRGKRCHATSTEGCSCKSVVWCSGVLALLYQYGFNFSSAGSLHGRNAYGASSNTSRTCQKFAQQLQMVLKENAETPLWTLIVSIQKFLFYLRLPFLLVMASLWTLAAVTLLYNYILKLDLLHIKSHLHFPSTHKILPSALLTAGKVTALKKLIYYMP